MNKRFPIYVACPAHIATGGTEAAHALCYELRKLGFVANMFYIDVKPANDLIPNRFLRFQNPYCLKLHDSAQALLVIPETRTELIDKFPLMTKYIWWLSVDNYCRPFRLCGPRSMYHLLKDRITKRNVDFNDNSIRHLCQSHYAMDFLKRQGVQNACFLMDYLGDEHLSGVGQNESRENIVLYNPSKGLSFTRQIIKASPHSYKFIPLQNMSPGEVHSWCCRAKVYIDFGNHPGKDRFPREAAMAGCLVITSKRGSAAFYNDVPINDSYKFYDSRNNIPKITELILDCMNNYKKRWLDFEGYRDFIREDYTRFVKQVRAIFL